MEQFADFKINPLPVPTWNRLGMNSTTIQLPQSMPAFRMTDNSTQPITVPFPNLAEMETGMCADFLAQSQHTTIRQHADSKAVKQAIMEIKCDAENKGSLLTEIWAEAGSDLTVFQFISGTDAAPDTNVCAMQTKLQLDTGARVKLVQVQLLETPYTFLNDIGAVCEDDAQFELVQLFLGGADTYTGCRTKLNGKRSSFRANIGYFAKDARCIDMNYVADHVCPKTKSQIQANGVLDDHARKIFRGTIDFKHGASGAVGAELEDILILGEDAINRTIPLILCAEEDVQGSHGASIGQPDPDILFYMASRGISEADACRILARSKLDAICRQIGDSDQQTRIASYLTEVMGFGESF